MEQHTYGAKSPESIAFHIAVYETIQKVPFGHVTAYGHIAYLVGAPEKSRHVGFALKRLPSVSLAEEQPNAGRALPPLNTNTVPWWRVINSQGKISLIAERKARQVQRLREEGVEVNEAAGSVSLATYGWFPDALEDDSEVESDY